MSGACSERPVVLSYRFAYLQKGVSWLYRQVCGLNRFENIILARHLHNLDVYPYDRLITLSKDPFRQLHRYYWRHIRKKPVPLSWFDVRQIQKIVKKNQVDLIHIYVGTDAVPLIPYLKVESRPKIISFHGVDTSDALDQQDFEELVKYTDLFLARCESMRDVLVERGCPRERIRLNPTGVPVPDAVPECRLPDRDRGEPMRLLQACRLVEKKGLDITVDAVARLKKKNFPVTLDIAGNGRCEQDLKKQVEQLGLGDVVRFLGFVENEQLLDSLENYHLFLHPSRTTETNDREGIPNSMLEAMAYGVPAIATKHAGIPEVLNHEENGLLMNGHGAAELAELIRQAAEQDGLYAKLSAGARDTIVNQFSFGHNIECLEASYFSVLEGKE